MRLIVDLEGVVQGVGMRPALYRLAVRAGLGGWVQNRSGSVRLVLMGSDRKLQRFLQELPKSLPPGARIDRLRRGTPEPWPLIDRPPPVGFQIRPSHQGDTVLMTIPPDQAVCRDCLQEVFDPSPGNRRYGYPFTTCTLCGPRYTVVNSLPYDREATTMARFPLCSGCRKEYDDPGDRRFHAESMGCPLCGPKLQLLNTKGEPLKDQRLASARRALAEGKILAIKGIGGFQLVADAFNRSALNRLRQGKNRPHKPLAVMAGKKAGLRSLCRITDAGVRLLSHPSAPIVVLDLLPNRTDGGRSLPLDLLAPDSDTLGVMLPTTPLHHLLMTPLAGDEQPAFELLAVTSGNRSGEPLCIDNQEALDRLSAMANLFLYHDRDILRRNDDSVCVPTGGSGQVWRRARGYVPETVRLQKSLQGEILALGADLKNTFAVGYGNSVVLSPHMGNLQGLQVINAQERAVKAFLNLLRIKPRVVATDSHPDMHTTRLGQRLAEKWRIPTTLIQHHHAHAAACMAEHGAEKGLAVVLDGTGLGTDGTIWGGELLHVTPEGFHRWATFQGVPLPGGDAAVRQPVRQLVARLVAAGIDITPKLCQQWSIPASEAEIWQQQCQKRLNAPVSHSAGRLFDAFAAMLGLAPDKITYEGQAAIRLEKAARKWHSSHSLMVVPFAVKEQNQWLEIDWNPAFHWGLAHCVIREDQSKVAFAMHQAIAKAVVTMVRFGVEQTGETQIFFTGGVFMNQLLSGMLRSMLSQDSLTPHFHQKVPPNDNGIALGQVVIAGHRPSRSG